jgi:hypothetical protein
MPTVLSVDGFRFFFFSDEGSEPCHIHIKKGEARGKVWLEPAYEEDYFYGFTIQEQRKIRKIIKIIKENKHLISTKWYEYFK